MVSLLRLLLLHLGILLYSDSCKGIKYVKLGVSIPWSGKNWPAGPRFASGITIAVDKINQDPNLLTGYNVSFTWGDSQCDESASLRTVVDQRTLLKPSVDAFIGPACSDGCKGAGFLAAHWNVPIVSYGCGSEELSDLNEFPTFVRTVGVYSKSGRIFVGLMKYHKWDRVAILTSTAGIWSSIMNSVHKDITSTTGLMVSYYMNFHPESVSDEFLLKILEESSKKAHIFILGGYGSLVRRIMLLADKLHLVKEGHSFITYELLLESCKLKIDPNEDIKACKLYEGILDISLFVPATAEYSSFTSEVKRRMADSPFNRAMLPNEEVEIYAAFLHDAALLYAHALNTTLANGGSIADGRAIVSNMLNFSFAGASGKVVIDSVGDRASALQLKNIQNGTYVRVFNYYTADNRLEFLNATHIMWPGGTKKAPVGSPECGFHNEFCPAPSNTTDKWIYGVAAALIILLLMVIGIFIIAHVRRKAFEKALLSQHWKVDFGELQFSRRTHGWGSKRSMIDVSRGSVDHGSHTSISSTVHEEAGHGQIFTSVGIYGGKYVAVKRIRKSSIALTREILLELKEVSEIQHQNMNPFIGACIEPPNICLLTQYCNKGSLQDVLYNENLKLDWMFQISIASDIARGMQYLHTTPLHIHGNLKSSNCVIDSRWACKITDYGLHKFKENQEPDIEKGEDYHYTQLFWRAPENLRNLKAPRLQPGDVYSYGIILQEIVLRDLPYCMFENMSPKEIVALVAKDNLTPFRPNVSPGLVTSSYMELMRQCWDEQPQTRPRFDDIMKTIKKINGGKHLNIVDNMITMMEKYTDHLEDLVAERTKQLEEEKAKTDELLYRMLPRSVAEQLKKGEPVKAESFEMVTIFFSDIVGFTKLASESTPLQVVDLLNDLYTCFDNILEPYDVYKVETIGDAYMVCSGLPKRNGNRHAGEIARMSLDLLSAMTTFQIRHRSNYQLQLRIGIHSGPCVAGVVGLKMPRYCLFGDTVNYASRMESSGLALRIHVSPECAKVLNDLRGYYLQIRGPVTMKGKGTVVTYFLEGCEGFNKELPDLSRAASIAETTFK